VWTACSVLLLLRRRLAVVVKEVVAASWVVQVLGRRIHKESFCAFALVV
jgi:hypothetical protein